MDEREVIKRRKNREEISEAGWRGELKKERNRKKSGKKQNKSYTKKD